MEQPAGTSSSFVQLLDVSRNYGETRAVRNVTMDLAIRGKIHALVGENGAGKSTCLGMAGGRVAPSSGLVLVDGSQLPPGSPRAAKRLGVHAIYQELTIVPALTPEANVYLGQNISRGGWLKETEMRRGYEELCGQFGVLPVSTRQAGNLSVAEQQMLEILRALASDTKCILFDEPTASLAQAERDALFSTMHDLKAEGLALTVVSHNLDEVKEHSDFITVFRDGALVETRPAAQWTKREIVGSMLGGHARGANIASGQRQRAVKQRPAEIQPVMEVSGLTHAGIIENVSFSLYAGEVLGIAGLVGSGRTSILRALAGLDARATGSVIIEGKPAGVPKNVREARAAGISLLPEDRKGQGLLLARSGAENVTLGEWGSVSRFSFIRERGLIASAIASARPVGFNTSRLGENAGRLSGGNQQKLMIARWIHTSFPILLADEPTRGVDVGAKAEILVALESIVAEGRSMIVVSSELEEITGMSDRVLVIHEGRALAMLDSRDGPITPARILQIIFDAADMDAAEPDTAVLGSAESALQVEQAQTRGEF
jgi:rhamnose transport system ATP-binding protein